MSIIAARDLKLYKESLKLSSVQQNLVVGSMLGDGNLRFVNRNKEVSFIVDHSCAQQDYVWWKYAIMKEWVLTEPKIVERIYHKDRQRKLTSIRFSTISHSELTFWYRQFYKHGVKTIPENIRELLISPLALAIWFMDDGNKNGKAVFLNTQQFSLREQETLIHCLQENFSLRATINKHWLFKGKQLYRIRIDTESTVRLTSLIGHLLLPFLCYKLPQYPRNDLVRCASDQMAVLQSL